MGIKGRTIFELTDVNTGETEIIEDSNMVTNGLQEFFDPCGSWGIYPFCERNSREHRVRNNFTSGLLLFNSRLDENVENIYAGADVQMIGNGAMGVSNSGTVTELGSYNATESGVQEDGSMKYVYDFLTSQANGTIQCACLTSKVGGYMGYGNASTKRVYDEDWTDNYYQPLNYKYFDWMTINNYFYGTCVMYASYEEDAVYIVDPGCIFNDTSNELHWTKTGKICIKKRRLGVKSVGLADYNHVDKASEIIDVAIPQEILSYMSSGSGYYTSYISPYADGHKREIFIIFSKSNQSCSNGSFFWVMKIDKDMQATAYKVTNNTGYTIYNMAYSLINKDFNYCAFDNDYLWCWLKKDSTYSLVGIKYSDSTQIIETTAFTSGYLGITKTFDHLIEYGGTYVNSTQTMNKAILNTITNKWFTVNGRTRDTSSYPGWFKVVFYDKKGLYLTNDSYDYFYLIKDPRYLATINNLSTPVVKTSSKTMKVTYILKDGGDA